MWFRRRPTIDGDVMTWQVECWQWLDAILGRVDGMPPRDLVTPDRNWLPPVEVQGHARAEHVFNVVRSKAGMADWPCDLVAQEQRPNMADLVPYFRTEGESSAAGTFGRKGNRAVVTYDPALLKRPIALIATLIHELAHYRLAGAPEAPPGGDEVMEPATDLATVHLGFGLFGANSAFEFGQFTDFDRQGWSSSRLGYLTESEWAFALALFCELRNVEPSRYRAHAKDTVRSMIDRNRAYLRKHPDVFAECRSPSGT